MWVLSENEKFFEEIEIEYIPGLYKIFDEILVNAADNYQREKETMNRIDVIIDESKGMIKIWNNGRAIPV
jgi:DNA topoisomerase-2